MGYMKEYLLAQREYDNRQPPEYWMNDEDDETEQETGLCKHRARRRASRIIPSGEAHDQDDAA